MAAAALCAALMSLTFAVLFFSRHPLFVGLTYIAIICALLCTAIGVLLHRSFTFIICSDPFLSYFGRPVQVYPTLLLVLVVCFIYAVISPFIMPAGALFFGLAYLVYKYQVCTHGIITFSTCFFYKVCCTTLAVYVQRVKF